MIASQILSCISHENIPQHREKCKICIGCVIQVFRSMKRPNGPCHERNGDCEENKCFEHRFDSISQSLQPSHCEASNTMIEGVEHTNYCRPVMQMPLKIKFPQLTVWCTSNRMHGTAEENGMDLPQAVDVRLRIGSDVVLAITRETDPCERMEALAAGLKAALTPDWRGGACARVVTGGWIAIGDTIRIEEP